MADAELDAYVRAQLAQASYGSTNEHDAEIVMYTNRENRVSHFAIRSGVEGWVSKVGTGGNVLLHELRAFTADYGLPTAFFKR